ncbi:MAG TPA: class I SAM-dependent methyltransferase, partial [Myxococcaceae bacterium]
MSWQKYLLVPKLMWHGIRARADDATAWNRYWGGIQRTGAEGEVLWDAGSQNEIASSLERLLPRMDSGLPIVDVGCGNGRHTRTLASHFPKALGIDLSTQAVEKARQESQGLSNVSYEVLDLSVPGAGRKRATGLGDVNVYVRGVFHILDHPRLVAMVSNLRDMLGSRGTLYLLETAHQGSPLDYMMSLGATASSIPSPLRRLIESGIRAPRTFGEKRFREYFSEAQWETLASGPA